jgi:hypothetical protein
MASPVVAKTGSVPWHFWLAGHVLTVRDRVGMVESFKSNAEILKFFLFFS